MTDNTRVLFQDLLTPSALEVLQATSNKDHYISGPLKFRVLPDIKAIAIRERGTIDKEAAMVTWTADGRQTANAAKYLDLATRYWNYLR